MHPVHHENPSAADTSTSCAMTMTNPRRRWSMVHAGLVMVVLMASSHSVHCASLNLDHIMPQPHDKHKSQHTTIVEPICGIADASEPYLTERSFLSSLTLDLNPGLTSAGPCKTILIAPDSNVLFVRLHRIKPVHGKPSASSRNMDSGLTTTAAGRNSTRSCPLSIISTSDPLKSPWKLDPCMLEDITKGMSLQPEDQVKILPGRLKIIWNHYGHAPNFRLIITAMGKGQSCLEEHKHACMRFGTEVMLCISDDLVCDGIRHCPAGNGFESDEDPEMCLRFKNNHPQHTSEMSIWKKFSNELEKRVPPSTATNGSPHEAETTIKTKVTTPQPADAGKAAKEARDRTSLTRGLSRYGPWGYLMLGMLLCGGALLVCGLWECCCRPKKPEVPGDGSSIDSTHSTNSAAVNNTSTAEPPNYDEIDPPPSYAVLFPNQKFDAATPSTSSQQSHAATSQTTTTTIASSTTTLLTSTSNPSGSNSNH